MNNRTSVFRPIVLTFLMALPFGFGVGFLAAGIYEGWREFKREVLEIKVSNGYDNHSLGFLANGTPIVRDHKNVSNREWQDIYTHMNGTPITQEEHEQILHPQRLRHDSSRRRHPFDRAPFEELLSNRNRWWGFRDPENRSIEWTWEPALKSPTKRVLTGRYRMTDAVVWFITPSGFIPGTSKLPDSVSGFQSPRDWRQEHELVAFQSAGKLMAINLTEKTVTTITEIDTSQQAWSMFNQTDEIGWRFAIQNSDSLEVYSGQGQRLFTYTTGSAANGTPDLYTPENGQFIVTRTSSREEKRLPGGGRHYKTNLVAAWLDDSGRETRTLKFQNVFSNVPGKSDSTIVNSIDWLMESIGPGLMVPEPAVICGVIYVLIPWIITTMFPERPVSEAIDEILIEIPYAIPVAAVVALICAISCWRRQQRYQAEWTKTWVIFVFLFGLPAWIAWRVHRNWPPRELIDTSGTDFIGPEPNGLEIR